VALVDACDASLTEAKIRRHVPGFDSWGLHCGRSVDEALDVAHPDVLYVALPPSRHDGEIVRAARRGTHIFAEKPVSLYLDEARDMERAIRESGVLAVVGFQHRYDSHNWAIREYLAGKRPVMVTVVQHGTVEGHSTKHTATEELGGPTNRAWAANREWSGSTVVEAGIHQTDLMRYWCGDIAWVSARYVHRTEEDVLDGADNPHAYSVTFRFESGAIGNLILSRLRGVYRNESYQCILWTRGHLRVEGGEVVAYTYDGPYPPATAPSPRDIRHVLPVPPPVNATEAISRAFLLAVQNGSAEGLRSTFSASMNSLAAVLGANVSDALGGERVLLRDLLGDDRYAPFRARPA
jgi:predicted dehydrogenase